MEHHENFSCLQPTYYFRLQFEEFLWPFRHLIFIYATWKLQLSIINCLTILYAFCGGNSVNKRLWHLCLDFIILGSVRDTTSNGHKVCPGTEQGAVLSDRLPAVWQTCWNTNTNERGDSRLSAYVHLLFVPKAPQCFVCVCQQHLSTSALVIHVVLTQSQDMLHKWSTYSITEVHIRIFPPHISSLERKKPHKLNESSKLA